MTRDLRHTFLFLCSTSALALLPARALGYEDQATLGVGLGYANIVSDALPTHGLLLASEASLGLDDIWTVRTGFTFGYHPHADALSVLLLQSEILYMVDVFEWVPYFGAGIDALAVLRGVSFDADFAAHPVFGVDWLTSRELVFGFAVRSIFLLTALDHDPVYFTCTLSGSLLFDL